MISAGRLRFRAQVKRETTTDNVGKKNASFATSVGYFRCELVDTGSSEVDYSEGVVTANTWQCMTRWDNVIRLGLLATDRLIIENKTYRIMGIRNEHNRNRLATIDIAEIV